MKTVGNAFFTYKVLHPEGEKTMIEAAFRKHMKCTEERVKNKVDFWAHLYKGS